jgi:putative membrane protein
MSEHHGPDRDGAAPDDPAPQLALMQRMLDLAVQRTDLAVQRTDLAAQRTEMSAERSYLNVERTLSVWIRTALAVMVVGIAVDRFGLFLRENRGAHVGDGSTSDLVGAALVALGVVVAVVPAVRFGRYTRTYRRTHALPHHHGPFMAPAFAALVAAAGAVLLVLLLLPA